MVTGGRRGDRRSTIPDICSQPVVNSAFFFYKVATTWCCTHLSLLYPSPREMLCGTIYTFCKHKKLNNKLSFVLKMLFHLYIQAPLGLFYKEMVAPKLEEKHIFLLAFNTSTLWCTTHVLRIVWLEKCLQVKASLSLFTDLLYTNVCM